LAIRVFSGFILVGLAASLLAARAEDGAIPKTSLDDEPPRLVSAFFGLDHALPASPVLCREAAGQDGMPVTFSRRVIEPIDPKAFTVRTRSGALRHPVCATTAPANARGKHHTVLLIGDLGSEDGGAMCGTSPCPLDPPITVEVTGELPLESGGNGKGLSGPVIPLAAGPTLALALGFKGGTYPSDCPPETRQIVVAIWAGGVRPKPGADQTAHREGYRVATSQGEVRPFALAALNNQDNYVHLRLNTDVPAERVSFAPGILVDPRGDVNPDTSVAVSQAR
jgi:hypothetical protein